MKSFKTYIKETISKEDGKFVVRSKSGRNLGKSETLEGAKRRLRQVEWFKRHKT